MSQTDLIIHDEKDNVAVVVIDKTQKNQECTGWIMENDKTVKIKSINEIPLGHKIALKDFKEGDTILKYGHDIILPFLCFYIVNMNMLAFFYRFNNFTYIMSIF